MVNIKEGKLFQLKDKSFKKIINPNNVKNFGFCSKGQLLFFGGEKNKEN